jgi:hypothetical protein
MKIPGCRFLPPLALLTLLFLPLFFQVTYARILAVPDQMFTIQMGVDSSSNGDTVLVSPGRYVENVNLSGRTITIGSWLLTTGDLRYIAETVIDGSRNGRSAFRMAGAESGVITGFTIENDSSDFGAGVYIRGGMPTLSHLVIRNCSVMRNGTAIYVTGGAVATIRDVELYDNNCGYVGGAMSVFGGSQANLERALVHNNYSVHVGGAFHVSSSTLRLKNCTVVDNAALHTGGAVYLTSGARAEVSNSILRGNEPDESWILEGGNHTVFQAEFSNIDGGVERIYGPIPENIEWGVGNIDVEPDFVDREGRDFRLQPGSSCIDAGNYESAFDPDETRRDLGALPFTHEEGSGQRVRWVPGNYNTIQDAIDAANDGDVVLVWPGSYRSSLQLTKSITLASLAISRGRIPFQMNFRDSTILTSPGQMPAFAVFSEENRINTRIEGFTISRSQQGGIILVDCDASITGCLVENNINGGLFGNRARIRVTETEFIQNLALNGGAIYLRDSEISIEDSKICGGEAIEQGSAIYASESHLELQRVEITGNQSAEGSGFYLLNSSLNGNKLTFSNNVNENDGAGLVFECSQGEQPVESAIRSSIIYGNGTPSLAFINENDSRLYLSYCDLDSLSGDERGITLENVIDLNPAFGDGDNGDYTLSADSPCIDAGDPDEPRDPDGTRADMGAYYYHQDIQREALTLHVPDEYPTIQSAIDYATIGDTILVAPGRYRENLTYRGKNLILASWFILERYPDYIDSTIIDGGESGSVVSFTRSEGVSAHLTRFTITSGHSQEGGGIFCFRSSPTIEYCLIRGNSAVDGGGAIYAYGAGPSLQNLTIVDNRSDNGGGAIHLRNSAYPYLDNCIIRENAPEEIVGSADRDLSTINVAYSNLAGGEEGIILNGNTLVRWETGNIDLDPRFVDPQVGNFRLTEESPCLNTGSPNLPLDPDSSRSDMGAYHFNSLIDGEQEFILSLQRGWSLVGSPIPPENPSFPVVWGRLAAEGAVHLVKNQDGEFYWPARNFNNIPAWDARQGYHVRMDSPGELSFKGRFLPEDEPIPLREGWSIVTYLPAQPANAEDALAALGDDLVLIKDDMGRFYVPRFGYCNIPPLERGTGYRIKSAVERLLVWQVPEGQRGRIPVVEEKGHFETSEEPSIAALHFPASVATGHDMSILIEFKDVSAYLNSRSGIRLELGLFTQSGACVGSGAVKFNPEGETHIIGMAAWGDDPTTVEVEGASPGERLVLSIWSDDRQVTPVQEWLEGTGEFSVDGWGVLRVDAGSILPDRFELAEPFPNPFNSSTRILFRLPVEADVKVEVFDIGGRLVETLQSEQLPAGTHTLTWNSGGLQSGVYFLTLNAGGKSLTRKLALVR